MNSDFDELKANSMNLSNITKQQARDGIPFLPFMEKKTGVRHAIKNAIKDAADRRDVRLGCYSTC